MTKKIAVVGGGVVGATSAFYLTKTSGVEVTLFDEPTGQGTSASAGIISPWLSKRRNKAWYEMVKLGAAFYPAFLNEVLAGDDLPKAVYQQVGTLLFTKKEKNLEELLEIGLKRREEAPEIGELRIVSPAEIREQIPIYDKDKRALFASGGARVDGKELVNLLVQQSVKLGAQFVPEKVETIRKKDSQWKLQTETSTDVFDGVILATAAWLPELLEPLGYTVDIRPQKGQLAELETDWATDHWPVIMPTGEKDIIPFLDGKVLIGATHEDEAGFDLALEEETLVSMVENAQAQFSNAFSADDLVRGRVGTRAYTSDYAPFFGEVPEMPNVFTASGLGATGLTAGPIVGKTLVELMFNQQPSLNPEKYPIQQYVQKVRTDKGEE